MPRETALSASEKETLSTGGFVLEPTGVGTNDPLVQTETEHEALLRSSLSVEEASQRLGVVSSRIRQRLTSSPASLYGIRMSSGDWALPEFQFEGNELVPGLGEVVARLDPELHSVSVFHWFTLPNPDLVSEGHKGGLLSPRDWLLSGLSVQAVVDLAADL